MNPHFSYDQFRGLGHDIQLTLQRYDAPIEDFKTILLNYSFDYHPIKVDKARYDVMKEFGYIDDEIDDLCDEIKVDWEDRDAPYLFRRPLRLIEEFLE